MDKAILDSSCDFRSLTIDVISSDEVGRHTNEVVRIFNSYGTVIIAFQLDEEPREQLLCFKQIFGSTLPHDRADRDMIAEIAVSTDFQGYLGTSNLEHDFHTDGAYDEVPPCAIALRCETMARSGGITKIASAEALYCFLVQKDKKLADALFVSNALSVERAGRRTSQPVFRRTGNRIMIRYRWDKTSTSSHDPDVREAMRAIEGYLECRENYLAFPLLPRHVLITDNTRTLHARTAFSREDPRKLHRLFFSGDSASSIGLQFGFQPEELVTLK